MKKLVIGILAHVDAGKTTLTEGLLYVGGALRKLGRVDHRDAFLDTFALERERGITIFSKQAVLPMDGVELTLLDTPGHADFSAEAERTLQVLDCAILVVSGADGVQGHTLTLWRLLERYGVPTFLFVNKMDQPGTDRAALMAELKSRLDGGCVDFSRPGVEWGEEIALCGEEAMEEYLASGQLKDETVAALVGERKLFPCIFGAALKLVGVEELLESLPRFAPIPAYGDVFGAKVYKISRDSQGARLTHLKVTGGTLRVKDLLSGSRNGEDWQEKADQLRIYSGAKFQPTDAAKAGTVCAVTGLSRTSPGEGLGVEAASAPPTLEPALTCQVLLPDGCDPHTALTQLRQLEEEDPQLHVVWKEQTGRINVQLMGTIQQEILQRLLKDRFDLDVTFGPGAVVYRETIGAPVIGIGHFEPLRHYAEVHLLLEPLERGAGVRFATACPEEVLASGWQRLILSHLAGRSHLGVLTGAPITDMKITLLAGRAHEKHTEGGDFRQAAWRAVRQGLMSAQSVLLEPWYDFRLTVPAAQTGRAMADIQRMGGDFAPPETEGEDALIIGGAPVSALRDYAAEMTAYTKGRGRLVCVPGGYRPCQRQEAVVEAAGYDPERDLENPADSIFCAHGAGYLVKWSDVPAHAHVDSIVHLGGRPAGERTAATAVRSASYAGTAEQDRELQAIFERTYGPVRHRTFHRPLPEASGEVERSASSRPAGPEYLLVDGYNVIFAWDELKTVAAERLDAARRALCDLMSDYQGFRKCEVIVVFDAYKVKGGIEKVEKYHNIHVVYTKEAETADAYIERTTYQIGREHRVRVVSSDGAEQVIILGHGALRVSAAGFHDEMVQTSGEIRSILQKNNLAGKARPMREAMTKAMEEKKE
ncbi:putative small GTP-binding protein [Oscillibacter valericigenes Sjm18-20]|nr:putative small GTP-binding protein [Oscillibacter valericigenes Sjm18-20]